MRKQTDTSTNGLHQQTKEKSRRLASGEHTRRGRGPSASTTNSRSTRNEPSNRGAGGSHAQHELVGGGLHFSPGGGIGGTGNKSRIGGEQAVHCGGEGGRNLTCD